MNKIKQLREERGWSQGDLGKILSVQKSAVSKYETGKVPLTDDTIRKLVEIFGESADYILGLSNVRNKNETLQKDDSIETGLSPENIEELKKYAELLKLKQMAEKNKEESSDEISSI